MILSETIPTILTWSEIKSHCAQHDDEFKDLLNGFALAATEDLEKATNLAIGSRTSTILYSHDDHQKNNGRLLLPKGPVVSITSVTSNLDNRTLSEGSGGYELRKIGHGWYLHLYSTLNYPITVVAVLGHTTVPQSFKSTVLLMTEHKRINRGVTSERQQYEVAQGYQRIIDLYNTQKFMIGG